MPGSAARRNQLEQRVTGHRAEPLEVAGPEALDRGLVQHHLADRAELDPRGLAERALGQRCERAHRLQHVAEEGPGQSLERLLAAGREASMIPPRTAVLAGLDHRAATRAALRARRWNSGSARRSARPSHPEEQAGAALRRRQLLQEGVDRGDQQARRGGLQQAVERIEPPCDPIGRDPVVGQAVPGRPGRHRHLELGREEGHEAQRRSPASRATWSSCPAPRAASEPAELERIEALDRGTMAPRAACRTGGRTVDGGVRHWGRRGGRRAWELGPGESEG